MIRPLIFTDMDGTLLDHDTYSWQSAAAALNLCHSLNVPVIPCTSKTLAECLELQKNIQLPGPAIYENGSGSTLPKDQFPQQNRFIEDSTCPDRWRVEFSMPYTELRKCLEQLKHQFQFTGFGDMSVEHIQKHTGLSAHSAELARQRLHSEPMVWNDAPERIDEFKKALSQFGLSLTQGGRFYHALQKVDKGQAMRWLAKQYQQIWSCETRIIALGDGNNDLPMLEKADIAVVIKNPYKAPLKLAANPRQTQIFTDLPGPEGWNQAILQLLKKETLHG